MTTAVGALAAFHPAVVDWFSSSFPAPTPPQILGWPVIRRGDSCLILAPTGTGKTLAAFLWCLDRLLFSPVPPADARCRVLYISPLKALAVDVERNLRAPLSGIAAAAAAWGTEVPTPAIAVRTGDTPAGERTRFRREPADILITTPESLYLLLTSSARDTLRSVDTVIVDEIHALVPTKRGAHLALSLERLEALLGRAPQRIGLSATQRPLEETARFLSGMSKPAEIDGPEAAGPPALEPREMLDREFTTDGETMATRPVTIVDAGSRKPLRLQVEVPVEDMARLAAADERASATASPGAPRTSIWSAIHPRLVELVRAHRTTLIFVNNRRTAERLASAMNELAEETLVRSHHGSLAREQRLEVEDRLKAGAIRGLVATSSLELGIDMGAIDLVIQIEAPPSVASGLQRIGRAGHQANAVSEGVIFPKYRGDLVACAAVVREMEEGHVEAIRYPRNPLDVLAQQIVATVAMEDWTVEALYRTVCRAAPYARLSRSLFEGVLDMLSGRYPADEFAELRPRLTWDRVQGRLSAREGARRIAVVNGGTIPDRGLYGVFLAGGDRPIRVGELDEEMVFESRVGEVFLLGASSWRIEQITHDRVLVSPAPGEPGKMPFWRGEAAGRPLELGRQIGALVRELRAMPRAAALERLVNTHRLQPVAADNLLRYLQEQAAATDAIPDDQTVIVERTRDELGDWRTCVLSPFGGRIHAPWSMAAVARFARQGIDVEAMWTDDGFVIRAPESEVPPGPELLVPRAEDVEDLVLAQLGSTALFAARFREAAARALLLPRRRPGGRAPLWQQRKRASDLLAVSSRFGSFPILLEAYRECLHDIFDLPALQTILDQIARHTVRLVTVDSKLPSPFASSLLFGYVANYIYEGDAPLAERRAHALSIDQEKLRELLGDAELRELLDATAMEDVEQELQRLEPAYHARSADALHDLLLRLGDLTAEQIARRAEPAAATAGLTALQRAGRVLAIEVAGESRFIAVEDASRYRDAVGVRLPPGVPQALLEPVRDPQGDLALRYARTHGPFTAEALASRYALSKGTAAELLHRLARAGRLVEGAFRPGGREREWCDANVLRTIRRRSLARVRKEVEPVEPAVFGRLIARWQGLLQPRRGADAVLDAVESLQGAPLAASILETDLLPARVADYSPADLDAAMASGEIVWCGLESLGERDGRIALYLTDHLPQLWRPPASRDHGDLPARERRIVDHLRAVGASFFGALHDAAGGGYPQETVDALWNLVWDGVVTNDTCHALRAYTRPPEPSRRKRVTFEPAPSRSRRLVPPSAEGRWSLVESRMPAPVAATEWAAATAQQLLTRYGIVSRETAAAESIPGGFSAIYEVLKALEYRGRVRRGYFISGVGATQFALHPALDLLRSLRRGPDEPEVVTLAATDPANPYGTLFPWPAIEPQPEGGRGPTRTVGSSILLVDGAAAAYVGRGGKPLFVYLPEDEPDRSSTAKAVAARLAMLAATGEGRQGGLLVSDINGQSASSHPLAPFLREAGFVLTGLGYQLPRPKPTAAVSMRSPADRRRL